MTGKVDRQMRRFSVNVLVDRLMTYRLSPFLGLQPPGDQLRGPAFADLSHNPLSKSAGLQTGPLSASSFVLQGLPLRNVRQVQRSLFRRWMTTKLARDRRMVPTKFFCYLPDTATKSPENHNPLTLSDA